MGFVITSPLRGTCYMMQAFYWGLKSMCRCNKLADIYYIVPLKNIKHHLISLFKKVFCDLRDNKCGFGSTEMSNLHQSEVRKKKKNRLTEFCVFCLFVISADSQLL